MARHEVCGESVQGYEFSSDPEDGSSECIDMLEETSISSVSIDIKDARSETSDIKSEVDVPDDEISDSAEAMRCWKRCCWLVGWCCESSLSITVRIDGVGILVTSN